MTLSKAATALRASLKRDFWGDAFERRRALHLIASDARRERTERGSKRNWAERSITSGRLVTLADEAYCKAAIGMVAGDRAAIANDLEAAGHANLAEAVRSRPLPVIDHGQ